MAWCRTSADTDKGVVYLLRPNAGIVKGILYLPIHTGFLHSLESV